MIQNRQVDSLSKSKMLHEQQKLKQLMIEQYYKYLAILRITNNFQKCIQTYSNINFSSYSGNIAIIGRISSISMGVDKEQDFCFPQIITTVNKLLFQKQTTPLTKRPFVPIARKFLISTNTYRKKLIVPLNKVISGGKKNKEQLFIFTNIQLLFRDQTQVCFGLTDNSFIIQLDQNFYSAIFKNLQQSLTSTYSDLSLNQLFTESQLLKGSTYVVQDIRNKVHENISNYVVLGTLKNISWQSIKKAVNAKEKQIVLDIIQDAYHNNYKTIGICKVYIRFDILDEEDLKNYLHQGCVYLFLITEVLLNDNVFLNLKLNFWRKNFIKITQSPIKLKEISELFEGMQVSPLNSMTNPYIYRNYYKFRVIKYELKLYYVKVVCQKCEKSIYRSSSYDYICRNDCGKVNGQILPWVIMGVMDETCYAELSIENKGVLDFFDISEQQSLKFKDEVARVEQEDGKAGITLYFKKNKDEFNEDEPNQIITSEKSQYLSQLIEKSLIKVVQKTIIGTGKINNNENFSSFEEEIKHEALTSFARPKQYFKKAKVFVNGHLRTFEGRGRLIPYIKVERVLSS